MLQSPNLRIVLNATLNDFRYFSMSPKWRQSQYFKEKMEIGVGLCLNQTLVPIAWKTAILSLGTNIHQ